MTAKEKEVIKEMLKLIQNINESTDRLNDKARVPQLELSAIVSKIKTLYETSIVLKYLHANADELIIKEVEEKVLKIDHKQKELEETVQEGEIDDTASIEEKKEAITPVPDINIDALQNEAKKLGIEESAESINESNQEQLTTVEDKIKGKEIEDLKAAIGLNEKFLFTNELFGGDHESFSIAVNALNEFTDLQEAKNYLEESRQLHNWDNESKTVNSFYGLLERRYKK